MDKFEQWFKTYRPSLDTSAIEAEFIFEAGQQSRQAELDQLNEVLDERTKEWLEAIKLGTYFQEAAKPLKDEVEQLNKTLSIKSKFLDDSDVANKFLNEQLEDKNKRIAELEMWIKGQIETLKCASKSWVYTEREQNLMLSQADDLEKALRGKDQYTEHRTKAEQQINKGARLTKHQIDLGDNNANS